MQNFNQQTSEPSRNGKLIRNFIMLFTALLWLPSMAQNSDSLSYTFLLLKDGTKASGKIIEKNENSIVLMDFTLGKLTIKNNQIVEETELANGEAYCFTMQAGKEYCGTVLRQDSMIHLNTVSIGEISINPLHILSVTDAADRKVVDGEVWFKNPHGTRYFYMPNAIPLKKGEGYFQNSMVLMNTVSYGVTDHVTVGGGFFIPVAFVVTGKIGYKVAPKVHVGGGMVFGGGINSLNFGLGAAYGEVTLGDENANLSLAAGMGFSKVNHYEYNRTYSQWEFGTSPIFTGSGMIRATNRFAFITENWFYPVKRYNYNQSGSFESTSYSFINSFGFRTMWPKSSFDIAAVRIASDGDGIVLPYLNYVFKF